MRPKSVVALVAGLCLVAPVVVLAPGVAAAKSLKPSGAALVHVGGDGQTAYAREKSSRTFIVKAPTDAVVDWVGVVKGKGDRSGSYTPTQLVKAWKALGHRSGVGVQSTITWFPKAGGDMNFRSAKVSDPRINRSGELVFTARLNDEVQGGLPSMLPDFGINIARAERQDRDDYPAYFGTTWITAGFGYQVWAAGDFSGGVQYQYLSPIPSTPPKGTPGVNCTSSSAAISVGGNKNENVPVPAWFECNSYVMNYGPSVSYVHYALDNPIDHTTVLPCWWLTWANGKFSSQMCASSPVRWENWP